MSYQNEFPRFVLDVPVPADWTDTSWHNDVCPSFETSTGLRIWVDFIDPDDRELQGARFHVDRLQEDGSQPENYFSSDDWTAILEFVEGCTPTMNKRDALFTYIARVHLGITTLETRNSDRLDFHEVSVWKLREALNAAYEAAAHEPTFMAAGTMHVE